MKPWTMLFFAAVAAVAFVVCGAAASAQEEEKDIYMPGDIIYEGTGSPVVFSHAMHAEGFGLACDVCHTAIFEVEAYSAENAGDFSMSSLNEGKYCGACHNGENAFSTADFMECARCHVGQEGKAAAKVTAKEVKGPPDTITLGSGDSIAEFRHSSHEPFKCRDCHTALFPMKKTESVAKMDDIYAGGACGSCHNAETAFGPYECSMCHPKM